MKKQILILTFFVAAFLAGNNAFGQVLYDANYVEGVSVACTPAVGLSCATDADPLHPLPGEVYTYAVTLTAGASTTPTIHWFVTDDLDVISVNGVLTTDIDAIGGDYVLTAGADPGTATNAKYNDATNTTPTIDISWNSFPGTTPVLLVAHVYDEIACTDNIEVWRIEPTFGFTLDIAGLLDDGTLGAEECVSPIVSAIYDGSANLTMDYGDNYVYFTVNAANFVDSWMPTMSASYTGTGTVSDIEWAYPDQAILGTAGAASGTWNSATTAVDASSASGGTVGAGGECIIVRVNVDHGSTENDYLAGSQTVTLSIDGIMSDPAAVGTATEYTNGNLADLDEPTTGTACANDITDEATYTITPRPALVDNTTDTPNVTDFEPKN